MSRIVFAILAHEHLTVIEHTIANIRQTCPNSDVIIFNGGRDDRWLQGASVPVAARSKPVRWGALVEVAYELMLELRPRSDYDALVVFDCDMMIIKSGYEQALESILQNFAYIAYDFSAYGHQAEKEPARTVTYHWAKWWSKLLECPTPYVVLNPGQVFRRDLCEYLADDPRTSSIIQTLRRFWTFAAEEVVWPTLAVSRGFPATANPGYHGVEARTFSPCELTLLWSDPSVYCIHKVGMRLDSADRQAISKLALHGASGDELRHAAGQRAGLQVPFFTHTERLRRLASSTVLELKSVLRGRPAAVKSKRVKAAGPHSWITWLVLLTGFPV
ncbi:MAG: hypothetical protein ABW278_11510 [Steroidobacteraceae bacterium]